MVRIFSDPSSPGIFQRGNVPQELVLTGCSAAHFFSESRLTMTPSRRCGQGDPKGRDVLLRKLNLDDFEFAILSAARHFFASFASPADSFWVNAFLRAESFFPGDASVETMRLVLNMVQQIRMSRRSTLRFSNPHCEYCTPFATEEERYLIQMLQTTRRGDLSTLYMSSMLLCEGHNTEMVHESIQRVMTMKDKAHLTQHTSVVPYV
mgnify:CR=1 FL=1